MSISKVFFSDGKEYSQLLDKDLIKLSKNNDKIALNTLIERYKDLVNAKVSKYYISGAEQEDIIQEGLIGLYKAIKNFDPEKENSFKTFANLCVERQLITALKSSNRQKHIPLNSYISLNNPNYENADGEDEMQLLDAVHSTSIEDPLDTITKSEYLKDVTDSINSSLSNFEKSVLNEFVEGKSYNEIAQNLNAPVKSIDNAIQRIRKKTAKSIENLT